MALTLAFLAALCSSIMNFFLRRNGYIGGSAKAYLALHFTFSLVAVFLLNNIIDITEKWSPTMLLIGGVVGLVNTCMMLVTARALELGPPGLTFAFQNTASVLPALMMALIFGATYGFRMTPWLVIGTLIVITGLFWASRGQTSKKRVPKRWYLYSLVMVLMQACILAAFQWRCLLVMEGLPAHSLIPVTCGIEEEKWFIVGLFLGSAVLQWIIFSVTEKRAPQKSEITHGVIGGIGNGTSTYLLLEATKIASPIENSILFPFFAIAVIVICNLWGQKVYGEKVAWPAYGLCSIGIVLAAI